MSVPKVPVISATQEDEEVGKLSLALFDFKGEREDMLTFKKGDIITVLEMNANGWWKGTGTNGRIGLFPFTYVELKVTVKESFPYARAVYALEPNEEDEEQLTLEEGEVITVLKQLDENWSYGRRQNGDKGRFPFKYVEMTGEYNEELFLKEVEKWKRIEEVKNREEEKMRVEKAAMERKFQEEKRDEHERKLKAELEKIKAELEEVKEKNQELTTELNAAREEFKKKEHQMLITQERTRRELDEAKKKVIRLEKESAANANTIVIQQRGNRNVRARGKGRRNIKQPKQVITTSKLPPSFTPEVLDVDEDPFADDEDSSDKKKKKLIPVVNSIYNSATQANNKATPSNKNVSRLAGKTIKNDKVPIPTQKSPNKGSARGQVVTESWV